MSTSEAIVPASTQSKATMALSRIDPKISAALTRMSEASGLYFGVMAVQGLDVIQRGALVAVATSQLRSALTDDLMKAVVMPLLNTAVGFDSDKNPAKGWSGPQYSMETVRECVIHATLVGLPMTGNCFNIIAGNMYPRKEGYEVLLAPLCSYSVSPQVPTLPPELLDGGGYVTVPVKVQYRPTGSDESAPPLKHQAAYLVKVSAKNKVGPESVAGKATRKALRDLHRILTGLQLADADEVEAPPQGSEKTPGKPGVAAIVGSPRCLTDEEQAAVVEDLGKAGITIKRLENHLGCPLEDVNSQNPVESVRAAIHELMPRRRATQGDEGST